MTNYFVSELTDQELSIQDLQAANGGVFLLLLSALLPGVANAPGKGDDVYTKPAIPEVIKKIPVLEFGTKPTWPHAFFESMLGENLVRRDGLLSTQPCLPSTFLIGSARNCTPGS